MKNHTLALSLFLLLSIAACSPQRSTKVLDGTIDQNNTSLEDQNNTSLEDQNNTSSEDQNNTSSEPAETVIKPESEPVEKSSVGVALASDGFNFFVGDGSQTRRLTFGTDMAVVKQALTNAFGEPTQVEKNLCEPQGKSFDTITWPNGLVVQGIAGEFVGWGMREASLGTVDGFKVGSTLSELKERNPNVKVFEDTLGPQFQIGELEGSLSSMNADAVVTRLSAGNQCVYR